MGAYFLLYGLSGVRSADEFCYQLFSWPGKEVVSANIQVLYCAVLHIHVKFNDAGRETPDVAEGIFWRIAEIPFRRGVAALFQFLYAPDIFRSKAIGGNSFYMRADIIAEESGEPEDVGRAVFEGCGGNGILQDAFRSQMLFDVGNSLYIAFDSLSDKFLRSWPKSPGKVCGTDVKHEGSVHEDAVPVDADSVAGDFLSVYGNVVTALKLSVYAQASESVYDRGGEPAEHL